MLQLSANGRCEEFYIFLSKVLADNRGVGLLYQYNFSPNIDSAFKALYMEDTSVCYLMGERAILGKHYDSWSREQPLVFPRKDRFCVGKMKCLSSF